MTYAGDVTALSPVGYWRLGDASGTAAVATVGSNGTYVDTPTLGVAGLLTGDADTAVSCLAGNEEITCPATAASNFVVTCWYKFSSSPGVILRDNTATNGWFVQALTERITLRVSGTNYETNYRTEYLNDGNRHFIVLAATATTVKLYIDGVERFSAARGATTNFVSPWHFARNGTSSGFVRGTFDEIAMFSTITAADVETLWESGSGETVVQSAREYEDYAEVLTTGTEGAVNLLAEDYVEVLTGIGKSTLNDEYVEVLATGADGAVNLLAEDYVEVVTEQSSAERLYETYVEVLLVEKAAGPTVPPCGCPSDRWLVESTVLATGEVYASLEPLSIDVEELLNEPGRGSLMLATKDTRLLDVWPGFTGIYVTHLPSNTTLGFYVEQVSADSGGTTMVGLQSIDMYLWRRMMTTKQVFTGSQTAAGATLVGLAAANGISLVGAAAPSAISWMRTFEAWERTIIGDAIRELVDSASGPDYVLEHVKTGNQWLTRMVFVDDAGVDTGIVFASDREAVAYSVEVNQSEQATYVDALGEGDGAARLIRHAEDLSVYPRWDARPEWSDVNVSVTLQRNANGYLEKFKEPTAVPSVTIAGPDFEGARPGTIVTVETCFGAASFQGKAQVVGVAYSVDADSPDVRTFTLRPLVSAHESVMNQVPCESPCPDC